MKRLLYAVWGALVTASFLEYIPMDKLFDFFEVEAASMQGFVIFALIAYIPMSIISDLLPKKCDPPIILAIAYCVGCGAATFFAYKVIPALTPFFNDHGYITNGIIWFACLLIATLILEAANHTLNFRDACIDAFVAMFLTAAFTLVLFLCHLEPWRLQTYAQLSLVAIIMYAVADVFHMPQEHR